MVSKVGNIIFDGNEMMLFTDSDMDDNKIIIGRKGAELSSNESIPSSRKFIVANQKTANLLYQLHLKKERKEKLKKLNEK